MVQPSQRAHSVSVSKLPLQRSPCRYRRWPQDPQWVSGNLAPGNRGVFFMSARWYVYRVNIGAELVYIGKGCGDRYIGSAKRIGGIAGILEWFRDERKALLREIDLIAKYRPRLNKTAGGEGRSFTEAFQAAKDARIGIRWEREAYEKEDRTGNWIDRLIAANFAKVELNSRGIKWPSEGPAPEQDDPRVAEAKRRLSSWLQSKEAVLLPSITCLELCAMFHSRHRYDSTPPSPRPHSCMRSCPRRK